MPAQVWESSLFGKKLEYICSSAPLFPFPDKRHLFVKLEKNQKPVSTFLIDGHSAAQRFQQLGVFFFFYLGYENSFPLVARTVFFKLGTSHGGWTAG
jgi:hypothetical protein